MFTFCGQLVAEDLKATSKGKLRNKSKESAIKVSGDWIDHYETHSNAINQLPIDEALGIK